MSSTLRWFKSSYSSDSGGNCVEVAFDWRKSSYSSSSGGDCVEVAVDQRASSHTIHLRDSKVTDGPTFTVAPSSWSAFLDWAK
ncbi:DUF397 domain-containing protein [Streptomyces sp. NPDC007861]|uniref:DUF397 domain-containing protein n=1 Tax=Streptomyces sp. NPDC007861 TaxID=3154893 RepID=UPI0033EF4CC0